jgi:hypothetical protein
VMCVQSDFFAKACDGGFKVRNQRTARPMFLLTVSQEAHTNAISLSEDNEHTVAAMIYFMYHGKYDAAHILPSAEYEAGAAMLLHVRVVGVAQKYFVEPLQKYAQGLAEQLMKDWDSASPTFAEAVHAIYTSTDDVASGTALRSSAVLAAMDNAFSIFGTEDEHLSRPREILLNETPGFVEDWARAMSYSNADFETVNKILNRDNVRLNDRCKKLQDELDKHKATSEEFKENTRKLAKDHVKLAERCDDLESQMRDKIIIPDRPTANPAYTTTGPEPDRYKCPNCEVFFFRVIPNNGRYHHQCFGYGWVGKLGK